MRAKGRVLLITDVTGPGGVGTHIAQLAVAGGRLGWDVLVLMEEAAVCDPMAQSLLQTGLRVTRSSLYRKFHSEEKIRKAVWSTFANHKPDVVHVQCGSPRSAIVPREVTLEASLPLVVTENFVSADLVIPESMLRRIRDLYRHSFAVIAVCEENLAILRNSFNLQCSRFPVIKYGVDLPALRPRKHLDGNLRAVTVARLSKRKGIDVLIRAVALLREETRSRFQLTIAGTGEDEDALKGLAANLGVTESISFCGWAFDVPKLLRNSDLFILPSIAEGQPIALLEALAAGLPCIASAVSGIPEALAHGKYGALVPPENPNALAAAISSFAREPANLSRKARSARPYLRRQHDPDRNAKQIIGLWQSATATSRPQTSSLLADSPKALRHERT